MNEDDPGDCVHDLFAHTMFGDTPLGRPVLGTVDTVNALDRDRDPPLLQQHYDPHAPGRRRRRQRRPRHGRPAGRARPSSGPAPSTRTDAAPDRARATAAAPCAPPAGSSCSDRKTEQAHVVLGMPGLARTDERRFALGVLNTALGGGMSLPAVPGGPGEARPGLLRLLATPRGYADSGLFGVYAGCRPSKVDEVLEICRDELDRVAARRPHRRGARPRQGPAAPARSCSAWRTPARG